MNSWVRNKLSHGVKHVERIVSQPVEPPDRVVREAGAVVDRLLSPGIIDYANTLEYAQIA